MDRKKTIIYLLLGLIVIGALALIISIARDEDPLVQPPPAEEPAPIINDNDQRVIVEMEDLSFQPETVSVQSGDTIRWVNTSPVDHTVTGFGVDELVQPGESFEYTFDQPGIYDYDCTLHPGMDGTIIVE